MAKNSDIAWTDHTFNPWIGCTKVSAACDNCYAEVYDNRFDGQRWGPHAARTRTKTWANPARWNRALEGTGKRQRVFCASLADVFDNHKSIQPQWRRDLWDLIEATPNLDWLLLTKRPQNVTRYLPEKWLSGEKRMRNLAIGATVEDQTAARQRIPHLVSLPFRNFLSCEPLLGPIDLSPWLKIEWVTLSTGGRWTERFAEVSGLDWVITGGESGANFRPTNPAWFRDLRDQCRAADVPFHFKQWGGQNQRQIKAKGRVLDGATHDEYLRTPIS